MKTTEQIEHDKNLRRVVVSSLVGAVIEWYDFFLYGVVAGLIFNHLYFPEFDDRIGTMLAFATFAVGFVARPLGGLVFGHFGDKIGRKKVLVLTLMIMGTGTVAIRMHSFVCQHRDLGPDPAHLVPCCARPRTRRRMGRRRADVLRVGSRAQARFFTPACRRWGFLSACCWPPASSASSPQCFPTKPSSAGAGASRSL